MSLNIWNLVANCYLHVAICLLEPAVVCVTYAIYFEYIALIGSTFVQKRLMLSANALRTCNEETFR